MGTFSKLYNALLLKPTNLPREGYKDVIVLREEEQEVSIAGTDWATHSVYWLIVR